MKLLIKGGRIADPSRNLDEVADLVVENGRITGITLEDVPADRVIDASGRIVCPGFVDIHMHEDPFDFESGRMKTDISRSMLLMGVTTAIGGNCGDNRYDPVRYYEYMDRRAGMINLGLMAGHTWIRNECGGTDKYAPVSAEVLNRMEALAEKCLDAGCMGISFGVKYVPGTGEEEMTRLASLCAARGLLVAAHVRSDVERVFGAVREMHELAVKTGCRVQISHIGSMGGYGQMERLLKEMEGYAQAGTDIMCDCYPYTAFSTTIGATTYDPENFSEYKADLSAVMMASGRYAGQRCTKEIYEWERANAPEDITVGFLMREDDVGAALKHPMVMLGSDGLRDGAFGHPRAAGAFPRFIAEYVRSGKVGFMEGLAKMSSIPARRLGLENKGTLRPGADADIVIFDYDRIKDMASFEEPALAPAGIDFVIIGGEVASENGRIARDDLGRPVRAARMNAARA